MERQAAFWPDRRSWDVGLPYQVRKIIHISEVSTDAILRRLGGGKISLI